MLQMAILSICPATCRHTFSGMSAMYSEMQRLRATGPIFLHAALRARYSTVHLDFAEIAKTKSLLSLIHRLR
jgi:hypothetical protein